MTKRDKLLQRIRNNPKAVTFDDLRLLLEDWGFVLDRVTGSHHSFHRSIGGRVWQVVIPYKRPHVKAKYVKDVLKAIEEIESENA